ncbi:MULTISPECIES: H-NS family nucleoid-associated regulatory protein [Stenotrophomonas]|nr:MULTISPECIES: H-NS histone family protein [Stenotrophomonas]
MGAPGAILDAGLSGRPRYFTSPLKSCLDTCAPQTEASGMHIDLTALNLRELDILIRAAKDRHKTLTGRAPAEKVRRMLATEARRAGYAIEEIFGPDADAARPEPKTRGRRKRAKVEPKYRDPDNRRNTWTGRGRMPRWLAAKTKHGRSVADFLIPGVARLTPKTQAVTGQRRLVKQG